jgi:hypothetical protein
VEGILPYFISISLVFQLENLLSADSAPQSDRLQGLA